ncbi:MAG: hypothetical protein WAW61_13480 [Methylococcaceae bacterium]
MGSIYSPRRLQHKKYGFIDVAVRNAWPALGRGTINKYLKLDNAIAPIQEKITVGFCYA